MNAEQEAKLLLLVNELTSLNRNLLNQIATDLSTIKAHMRQIDVGIDHIRRKTDTWIPRK